jgi:hypothetical protein
LVLVPVARPRVTSQITAASAPASSAVASAAYSARLIGTARSSPSTARQPVATAHVCATARSLGRRTKIAAGTSTAPASSAHPTLTSGHTAAGNSISSVSRTCSVNHAAVWAAVVPPTAHTPASVTNVTTTQPGTPERCCCGGGYGAGAYGGGALNGCAPACGGALNGCPPASIGGAHGFDSSPGCMPRR